MGPGALEARIKMTGWTYLWTKTWGYTNNKNTHNNRNTRVFVNRGGLQAPLVENARVPLSDITLAFTFG